jgi:hypothetical protein
MKRREFLEAALAASALAPFTAGRAVNADLPAITLAALKNKYDPTNFLRLNANIQPTV